MCKLITIAKQPGKNEDVSTFLDLQRETLKIEQDGIAALAVSQTGKITVKRSYGNYDEVIDWARKSVNSSRMISIHTRTSTSGVLGLENIHFFEADGYLIAHNGFVMKLANYDDYRYESDRRYLMDRSGTLKSPDEWDDDEYVNCRGCFESKAGMCKRHKRQEKQLIAKHSKGSIGFSIREPRVKSKTSQDCDTLEFLKLARKPITRDSITADAIKYDFAGVAIIVEKKTGNVFHLIKKKCPVLSNLSTWTAICSYDPVMSRYESRVGLLAGIPAIVGRNQKTISANKHTALQGIYTWNVMQELTFPENID